VDLFGAAEQIEAEWLDYCARFKALSNWCAHTAFPWGDPEDDWIRFTLARGRANAELHHQWRTRRTMHRGFADPHHPFRHQGSADLNSYKLFLEQNHALLNSAGRLGIIVPSNVYTDKGSTNLRRLFLDQCRWEWLFGFENREGIFDIHRSFKFCPLVIRKGGQTAAIRTAFMRRQLADWENAERHAMPYDREQVVKFSPRSRAILELRHPRDVAILEKMYANGVLLGDDSPNGWGLKYAREFDMTNDSKLFPPRPQWEERGFVPDEYGHWLKGPWRSISDFGFRISDSEEWSSPHVRARSVLQRPPGLILSRDGLHAICAEDIEDVALPLYEGRMIDHFDFSAKGWVSGKGRSAVWRDIPWPGKALEPQFILSLAEYAANCPWPGAARVSHMRVGSATNERSTIATATAGFPGGDTAAIFLPDSTSATLLASAAMASYCFDFTMRIRLGGLHMDYHVFEPCPLPTPANALRMHRFVEFAARIAFPAPLFAQKWNELAESEFAFLKTQRLRSLWAVTEHERLRLRCLLDLLSAQTYGLSLGDLAHILSCCDHPRASLISDNFTRALDPKGFWRVDKEKDPELRHTVLSLVAYHDLERMGLEAFLAQNDGEGWMLPETLRLADYGLGHDDRARESQPVAARLGPRFYPWQLEGTVEESWEECRRHAENLRLIRSVGAPTGPAALREDPTLYAAEIDLPGQPVERDLFGGEVSPPRRRRR
jgi:hypothetical protein